MTTEEQAAAAERIDQTIDDLTAEIKVSDELRLGFVEVARLSLSGEALGKIHEAIAYLESHLQIMRTLLGAAEAFKAHGYFKVPKQVLTPEIADEMKAELERIQTAYAWTIAGKMKLSPAVTE